MKTPDLNIPPIVHECLALRELVEDAEMMLTIAHAPTEWKLADWDGAVSQWCAQKAALRTKTTEEILAEREKGDEP